MYCFVYCVCGGWNVYCVDWCQLLVQWYGVVGYMLIVDYVESYYVCYVFVCFFVWNGGCKDVWWQCVVCGQLLVYFDWVGVVGCIGQLWCVVVVLCYLCQVMCVQLYVYYWVVQCVVVVLWQVVVVCDLCVGIWQQLYQVVCIGVGMCVVYLGVFGVGDCIGLGWVDVGLLCLWYYVVLVGQWEVLFVQVQCVVIGEGEYGVVVLVVLVGEQGGFVLGCFVVVVQGLCLFVLCVMWQVYCVQFKCLLYVQVGQQ